MNTIEPQEEVFPEEPIGEDYTAKTNLLKRTVRRRIPLVLVATFLYLLLRFIDPNRAFNPVHTQIFSILLAVVFSYSIYLYSYNKNVPSEDVYEYNIYARLKRMYGVFDFLSVIPYLMAIISVLNMFLISFSPISGSSMEPNFSDNEAVVFQHVTNQYDRFDVVILYVEELSEPYLIKRVIGLPGETILIENNEVYINGDVIPQTFIDQSVVETLCVRSNDLNRCTWFIPEDSYFVLGDNRDGSAIDSGFNGYSVDSRTFGPITTDQIFGSVILTFKDYNILD